MLVKRNTSRLYRRRGAPDASGYGDPARVAIEGGSAGGC